MGADEAQGMHAALVLSFDGWMRRVPLQQRAVVLGRAPECDVCLADGRLSRRHCRVSPDAGGGWLLEDLGSQAGTILDGVPLALPTPLRPGAVFQIGPVEGQLVSRSGGASMLSGEPERDERNVAALLGIVNELQKGQPLQELLRTIVDRALVLARGERGALLLADPRRALEVVVARDAAQHDLPRDQSLTRSLPGRALESGRAVVLTDASLSQQQALPQSVLHSQLRTVLCVPLPAPEGPMGVLYVDGSRPAEEFGPAELAVFEALAVQGAVAIERERLREEQARRETEARGRLELENATLKARLGPPEPIGESPRFLAVLEMLRRVAPADATVCLTGETGTGKEVLAGFLHRLGPRSSGPFVVVDCGAIPEGLIESVLFGHEKGAFTGAAAASQGRFRAADGGTLFLDEVGELPVALQTRLLRVLQERTVQPVGSGSSIPVDVRIVCATNRDLSQRVAQGLFRQDLYYRLAVLTIQIPPLRERPEDIPLLANAFLSRHAAARGAALTGFTRDALDSLLQHPWPGNVRELEYRIQRAALLASPPYVTRHDLWDAPADVSAGPLAVPATAAPADDGQAFATLPRAREQASHRFELAYVQEALRRTGGNVLRAARLAGVSKQMLRRLMDRHGIRRQQFLAPGAGPDSDGR